MLSTLALSLALQSGVYECPGNPNICDQSVEVFSTGNSVTHLRVEYVGWCGSMGPYTYSCFDQVCTDGNAEFTLQGKDTYHWKNLGYPYECDFQKR